MNSQFFGITPWYDWFIVTVPCDGLHHDPQIAAWCMQQFGEVEYGHLRVHHSQEFWFTDESHAHLFWITWG